MAKVYALDSTGIPKALERIHCTDEAKELQAVLELNLDLLPGEQISPYDPRRWLIVKREMPVPGPASGADRFSLDFLLADQDAVPTFVECKRFDDTRSRREVVGQILDYAANGQYYWTKDELRALAAETATRRGQASLEVALQELDPTEKLSSTDQFFERFHANLQEGQVRIIFFLEDSPLELRSIADFLNKQMELAEVLVVEARQYDHHGTRVIVPILIGYTDQIRQIKKAIEVTSVAGKPAWTKQTLIDNIRQKNRPDATKLAEDIIGGLEGRGLTFRGFSSSISYGLDAEGDFLSIVSITPTGIWFAIPKRATERLDPHWFKEWKQKANNIAPFYKPEALSEPTNLGALGPRFDALNGHAESVVAVIDEMMKELKNRSARQDSR